MSKINQSKKLLFITLIGFILSLLSGVNYSNLQNNQLYYDKIDLNQNYKINSDSRSLKTSGIANNWTIMVYVAADNNLESAGIEDLNEMESVQLPEGVELVTLFDRALGYTAVDGDWTTTRRYNITHDEDNDHINSEYEDLGELNMADPLTLESFINWSILNHPAEKYALIIWDHGMGVSYGANLGGACVDRYSSNDYLDLLEIDQAIKGKNINVLGFDCCVMSMIEIASQYQKDAEILVGSESVEPADGWAYDLIIEELVKNPNCTPEEFGEIICSTYAESYKYNYNWEDLPMVSLNLSNFVEIECEISKFLSAINQDYTKSIANIIQQAIERSQIVDSNENFVDFGDLFTNLESLFRFVYPDLCDYSNNISELYEQTILSFEIARPRTQRLTGASIQILPIQENIKYHDLDFCQNTSWDDFISTQKTIASTIKDDKYEPNDDFDEGSTLTNPTSINLTWCDQDWFEFYIVSNMSFSLILNETTFQSNEVEIKLYDSSLNLVDKDPFNITLQLEQSGYYYVLINASLKFIEIPYRLTYTSNITDDKFEDNNDFASAYVLSSGFYANLICWEDDFYQIHVPESNVLDITLIKPDKDFNINFFIYDSSRNEIDNWGTYYSVSSDSQYYLNAEDDVYIRIHPYYGFGIYYLNISLKFVEDDMFEQNDYIENASPIEPGYYSGLKMYDKDYFYLTVNEGENLEIKLYYSSSNVGIFMYDEEMNKIRAETSTFYSNSKFIQLKSISYYSEKTQDVIISIYLYSLGSLGQYSLKIQKTFQKDDVYEDNDVFEAAKTIQPGLYSDLKNLDNDYYKFLMHQGEYFKIAVSSNDTKYFRLFFYDSASNLLSSHINYREGENCYYYSNSDQYITFVVVPYYPEITVSYNLNLTLVNVDDDIFEQNDNPESAAPINPGLYSNLKYNDIDYYNISILEGESVEISFESDEYMTLSVSNSDSSFVRSNSGRNIIIKYLSNSNQALLINVRSFYSDTFVSYSLNISKKMEINDDLYEDNDDPKNGKMITSACFNNLVSLDHDYYNYSMQANEYLEINLYFPYDGIINLNLLVYDSNMNIITSRSADYCNKSVIYYSKSGETIVILVEHKYCATNYSLRFNILQDDFFEDNDHLESPVNLPVANYSNLVNLDDDCYNISIQAGKNYIFKVAPNERFISKSFSIYIYDSDLEYITSCYGGNRLRYYAFSCDCDDFLILKVFNFAEEWGMGNYSLNISVFTAKEDNYEINTNNEENDAPETPTRIDQGDYQNLMALDDDYYNISVGAGDILNVKCQFYGGDYEYGYTNIYIYDNNLMLDQSEFNGDYHFISYFFEDAGHVLIKIYISTGFTPYSMNISISHYDDDIYEENDIPQIAHHLSSGYYDNLKYYDDDYFNLTLHENEILKIELESPVAHQFTLTLLDSNLNKLDEIQFYHYYYYEEYFTFRFFSQIDQSVILHVYCTSRSGAYAMNISNLFIGSDDNYEENDISENAQLITSGNYIDLICLDDDYFNLTVNKGDLIDINLKFNTDYMNFDLTLFNESMDLLKYSHLEYNHESIQFYSEDNQFLIILIESKLGFGLYNLEIIINHFEEDLFEQNDIPGNAVPIGKGMYDNLMCLDDDYYKVSVSAGCSLFIWLTSSVVNLDLDLKIYDSNMNLLNSSISLTSNEFCSVFSWIPQDIIVLVYTYSGFGNYNLYLESTIQVEDDSFEDNDTPETAPLITSADYKDIIWLDMDYFNISIEKNKKITIKFDYNPNHIDLYCSLYDYNMNLLNSSETTPYLDYLCVLSDKNQVLMIQFVSRNGIGSYNFTIEIEEFNSIISPLPAPSSSGKSESSNKKYDDWSFMIVSSIITIGATVGIIISVLFLKRKISLKKD